MAENVVRDLEGCWLAVSSENIDTYLIAMELPLDRVGCCERRTLSKSKLWQKIHVIDDVIHLEMRHGNNRHIELKFRLDEPFEIRAGKRTSALACWRDGALVFDMVRLETGRRQTVERRRIGANMVQKMVSNDVTCSRTFVKVQETDLE